ncbi:MAG: F0F1 ATP synthase subunit B' [Hyphomicrobium sp.]
MTEPAIGENEVLSSGAVEKVFPPLDPTTLQPQLFWLAISFIVLYLLLKRFIIPRIGGIVEERQNTLQKDLNSAAQLKQEVDSAIKFYDKTLLTARTNAQNIGRKIQEDLSADLRKERQLAEAQLAEKLSKAEKTIIETKRNTFTKINDIALEISQPILNQLLGKNFSPEDIKRAMPERGRE